MTSTMLRGVNTPSVPLYDPALKGVRPWQAAIFGAVRLPTDPIGAFALTLTNVVVGSVIQIEPQAGGATLYNGTAATSTPLINLSAYAGGSPLNALRIKVRKGTASPFYQPFETLTTAVVGSQSIYVAQIPDE